MASRIFLLISFLLAVPIALFLGYSAATPDSTISLGTIGLALGLLALPILLRWHQALLVFCWNTVIAVPFLPGGLKVWMILSVASFAISFFTIGITGNMGGKDKLRQRASTVSWILLLLAAVVVVTAEMRGGFGIRATGDDVYGGRKYFFILFAIAGFFALKQVRIQEQSRWLYIGMFFCGTVLLAFSNLIYMAGPSFYWLFSIFPSEFAMGQASADIRLNSISRFTGFAFATVGPFCYMLARYGVRGIFTWHRPLKLLLLLGLLVVSVFGGFRSLLALLVGLIVIQAFFEKLWSPRNIILVLAAVLVVGGFVLPFTSKLPVAIQRTLSFLPVKVDPIVAADAAGSTEWRLRMWEELWEEVPEYFWVGKGYAFDPADLAIAQAGRGTDFDALMMAGDYHSGPFSVLLSFGIFGVLVFVSFLVASIRTLYLHYKQSVPELLNVNRFLLVCFLVRTGYFLFVVGDLAADLVVFCGLIGLSMALNSSDSSKEPDPKTTSNALFHNYAKL